jgi:putative addiction module component (TIGR02574 family)
MMAAEMEKTPLTNAQMAELQRRLDKYGDSMEGIPWEEVERELIKKERQTSPRDKAGRNQP